MYMYTYNNQSFIIFYDNIHTQQSERDENTTVLQGNNVENRLGAYVGTHVGAQGARAANQLRATARLALVRLRWAVTW